MGQELVPVNQSGRVVVASSPSDFERVFACFTEGETIADILARIDPQISSTVEYHVDINGREISPVMYAHTRPKIQASVGIRIMPHGAETFRSVATIGLAVTSLLLPGPGWLGALVFATGSLLINSLVPLPKSKLQDGTQISPVYALQGGSNTVNRWGTIPVILGTHKIAPYYGALPYTSLNGEDQFLHLLFVCGYEPLSISDIKIGNNDINNFEEVDYETFTSPGSSDLYPATIRETNDFSRRLFQNDLNILTTEPDTDFFSIDILFPNGILRQKNDGDRVAETVVIEWQYRAVGSSTWIGLDTIRETGVTGSPIRRTYTFTPPGSGTYEIGVTRITIDHAEGLETDGDNSRWTQSNWVTLRSGQYGEVIKFPGLRCLAVKIRASDQISGTVDNLTLVANNTTGNNPAQCFTHVLTGAANERATTADRIDPVEVPAWQTWCGANGKTFNAVMDTRSTVFETLRLICNLGRARPTQVNSLWSVVRDYQGKGPTQLFTSRNSRNLRVERRFVAFPHAFRCRFKNADRDWEEDERIVYADGRTGSNSSKFESLNLTGATNATLVYAEAKYREKEAKLRPETFRFETNPQHLKSVPGDVVLLESDAILTGLGSARVLSATDTVVALDAHFPADLSRSYAIQFQRLDGTLFIELVDSIGPDSYNTFTFTNAPISTLPDVDALVAYGEAGQETQELLLHEIEPTANYDATLVCFQHSPEVHDLGATPPWTPVTTLPTGSTVVQILTINSSDNVMDLDSGFLPRPSMMVVLAAGSPSTEHGSVRIELQYRSKDTGAAWSKLPLFGSSTTQIRVEQVTVGVTYEVRVRYVFDDGFLGVWDTQDHTVLGSESVPPQLDSVTVTNVTSVIRQYDFTVTAPPPDFTGVYWRYSSDLGAVWDDMTPLNAQPVPTGWQTTQPETAGEYKFCAKGANGTGQLSLLATCTTTTVNDAGGPVNP